MNYLDTVVLGIGDLASRTTSGILISAERSWAFWGPCKAVSSFGLGHHHFNGGPPRGDGWTRSSPCLCACMPVSEQTKDYG